MSTEVENSGSPAPTYQSQFGGLWPDRNNWQTTLQKKLQTGAITAAEATQVQFWVDNGYLIIPGAVSPRHIDLALQEIHKIYQTGVAFIETYEYGRVEYVRVEPRHRTMPHKLIDAYAHSAQIRQMVTAEKITRFLNIIFEEPALAFQSLYFETGSQQEIHQDSAYVRVSPTMHLAASWVALEDIKPGSGELEYFVGSHRNPEFLFAGTDKWMPGDTKEHDRFLSHIQEESKRRGLKRERFLPKKGDALIWHADLCHGGSPVSNVTTRRSFVTHWCPTSARPAYFDTPAFSGTMKLTPGAAVAFSFHGRSANPYVMPSKLQQLLRRFRLTTGGQRPEAPGR